MHQRLKSLVVLLCCTALVACSTMRNIAPRDAGLAPNDSLIVTTRDGKSVALEVTATTPEAIEGLVAGNPQPQRIARDQIERIERRERDAGKTILLAAGIALLVQVVLQSLSASVIINK